MKIPVYDQHEPLLANRSDEDYQIIMDLRALGAQDGQDEHFFSKLAALTPLPFEHLTQLSDWIDTLNRMDAHLTAILAKYPHWLLTASSAAMDAEELSAGEEDKDKQHVLVILRFTAALLEKAAGKEIYASAEALLSLMDATDHTIALAALSALVHLALPPRTYRAENNASKRASTALHRIGREGSAHSTVLAVVAEMVTELLAGPGSGTSTVVVVPAEPVSGNALYQPTSTSAEVQLMPASANARELLLRNEWLSRWQRRWLCWYARAVPSPLVIAQLVALVVSVVPSACQLVADKVEAVRRLLHLCCTPPVTAGAAAAHRFYCSALEGLVDNSVTPLHHRYPWVMMELGLGRGPQPSGPAQGQGTIPSLLRQGCAALLTGEHQDALEVLESITCLALSLSQGPGVMSMLVEQGLIQLLLDTLTQIQIPTESRSRIRDQQYICCCLLGELLEGALVHHPAAVVAYREASGSLGIWAQLNAVVLSQGAAGQQPDTPLRRCYLCSLLSMQLSYLQDAARPDTSSTSNEVGQLAIHYRSSAFADLFAQLFAHPLGGAVPTTALALLTEVISADPTPPTTLTALLATHSVIPYALDMARFLDIQNPRSPTSQTTRQISGDLAPALIGLVGAVSITAEGVAAVTASGVLGRVIERLCAGSHSNNGDTATSAGAAMEELLRHCPAHTPEVVSALIAAVHALQDEGEGAGAQDMEQVIAGYHRKMACALLMEGILVRPAVIAHFLSVGGLHCVLSLYRDSLGDSTLLPSLSCMTDTSLHTLGWIALKNILIHTLTAMMECAGQTLMKEFLVLLPSLIRDAKDSVRAYFNLGLDTQNLGSGSESGDLGSFMGLLEGLSKEPLQHIPSVLPAVTSMLRSLTNLAFHLEIWGMLCCPLPAPYAPSRIVPFAHLPADATAEVVAVIESLIRDVFLPVQLELSRAKEAHTQQTPLALNGLFTTQQLTELFPSSRNLFSTDLSADLSTDLSTELPALTQPCYHLLILSDTVVKAGPEDNAKKLHRLRGGAQVVADLRKTVHGVLRYRLVDTSHEVQGWVSLTKGPEVLLSVLSVSASPHPSTADSPPEATDTLASTSLRRAGFMSLFLLYSAIESGVLAPLARLMVRATTEDVHTPLVVAVIPKLMHLVRATVPDSQSLRSPDLGSAPTSPPLAVMPISKLYRYLRALEVLQTVLFDNRPRAKADTNSLLLLHLLSTEEIWKDLLSALGNVLQCCYAMPVNEVPFPAHWQEVSESMSDRQAYDLLLPSSNTKEVLIFLKYRAALKERRTFTLANMETVLNFLRNLVNSCCAPLNSGERALHAASASAGVFDPYHVRRRYLLLLAQYLPAFWSAPCSLPAETLKSVLDLLTITIRTLQEVRAYPVKAIALPNQLTRQRPIRADSTGAAAAGPAPGAAEPFVPNEASASLMVDMGFPRPIVLRAMALLSTNDPNQLAQFLLENSLMIDDLERAAQLARNAQAARAEALAPAPAAADAGNAMAVDGADPADQAPVVPAPSLRTTSLLSLLPATPAQTEAEMRECKEAVGNALLQLYRTALPAYLAMLRDGINEGDGTASMKREHFTATVLGQLLRVFEKYSLSEGTLRLLQLLHLHSAAIDVLSKGHQRHSLQGLLHGLVIVLNSKVFPSKGNNTPSTCELHYLLLSKDKRFNVLLPMVIDELAGFVKEQESATKPASEEDSSFLSVCLLYIDHLSQTILVDKESLRTSVKEIENIHKYNPCVLGELEALKCTAEDILSQDMRAYLAGFLEDTTTTTATAVTTKGETLLQRLLAARMSDDTMEEDEAPAPASSSDPTPAPPATPAASDAPAVYTPAAAPVPPFHPGSLDDTMRISCIDSILSLLRMSIPAHALQAALQLLLHLLVSSKAREHFLTARGHLLVLNSKVIVENHLQLLYTILQRCMEDDESLASNMANTMRLIYYKLLRQTGDGPIHLKTMVEICCPLIQRDAKVYLEVLDQVFTLTPQAGSVILSLKPVEEPAATVGSVRPRSDTNTSAPPSAVKKQRMSDGSSMTVDGLRARGNSLTRSRRPQVLAEIVLELCGQILTKFSTVRQLKQIACSESDKLVGQTVLSLADLLILLADLVSSIPLVAVVLQKVILVNSTSISSPAIVSMVGAQLLNVDLLPKTCLLNDQEIRLQNVDLDASMPFVSYLTQTIQMFVYSFASMEKVRLVQVPAKAEEPESSLLAKTIGGVAVFDSACYLLAALLSRPGSLRRDVLQQLLQQAQCPAPLSLDAFKHIACFAETVTMLLHPPKHWQNRNAFLLPMNDIVLYMLTLHYHLHLVNIFNSLPVADAQSAQANICIATVTAALDILNRKGTGLMSKVNTLGHALPAEMEEQTSIAPVLALTDAQEETLLGMTSAQDAGQADDVMDSESDNEAEEGDDGDEDNSVDEESQGSEDEDDGMIEEEEEEEDESDIEDDDENMQEAHRMHHHEHHHHEHDGDEDEEDEHDGHAVPDSDQEHDHDHDEDEVEEGGGSEDGEEDDQDDDPAPHDMSLALPPQVAGDDEEDEGFEIIEQEEEDDHLMEEMQVDEDDEMDLMDHRHEDDNSANDQIYEVNEHNAFLGQRRPRSARRGRPAHARHGITDLTQLFSGNPDGSRNGGMMQLVSSMMPDAQITTAHYARVDNNTGQVTLSISRRNSHTSGASHAMHSAGPSSAQPSSHPLLTVSADNSHARRGSIFSGFAGFSSGGAFFSGPSGGNIQIPNGMRLTMGSPLSLFGSAGTTAGYVTNDVIQRNQRVNTQSHRRRALGPILSDRRWGVDISESDPYSMRLQVLTNNLERYVRASHGGSMDDAESKAQPKNPFAPAGRGDKPQPFFMSTMFDIPGHLQRMPSHPVLPMLGGGARRVPSSAQHIYEETKEEGELAESKEDDAMPATLFGIPRSSIASRTDAEALRAFGAALAHARSQNGFQGMQEFHLPSSFEDFIRTASTPAQAAPAQPVAAPSNTASSATSAPSVPSDIAPDDDGDDSSDGSGNEGEAGDEDEQHAEGEPEDGEDVWEDVDEEGQDGEGEGELSGDEDHEDDEGAEGGEGDHDEQDDGEDQEMEADDDVHAEPHPQNEENILFVSSLPADLRREVLENADDEFLLGLPEDMQAEARSYQQETLDIQQQITLANEAAPADAMAVDAQPASAAVAAPVEAAPAVSVVLPATPPEPTGLDVLSALQSHLFQQPITATGVSIAKKDTFKELGAGYCTVTLGAQCPDAILPFNSLFILRILRLLCDASRARVTRNMLKLLNHVARHEAARGDLLGILFALIQQNVPALQEAIHRSTGGIDKQSHRLLSSTPVAIQAETEVLLQVVSAASTDLSLLRKLLTLMIYMLKKTESILWYELTKPQIVLDQNQRAAATSAEDPLLALYQTQPYPSGKSSYFLSLLTALAGLMDDLPCNDIELCLQFVEEVSGTWGKIIVPQANALCKKQITNETVSTAPALADQPEEAMDVAVASQPAAPLPADNSQQPPQPQTQQPAAQTLTMPFPMLSVDNMVFFRKILLTTNLSNISKKRSMRIMRHFSLYNNNWHLFLRECVATANELIHQCQEVFGGIQAILQSASSSSSTAAEVSAAVLSLPNALHEVKLLNIIKLMLVLRARSSPFAHLESVVISHYMSCLESATLWETLFHCLEAIKTLEGGSLSGGGEGAAAGSTATSAAGTAAGSEDNAQAQRLSPLTARFLPLIECFLTILGSTLQLKHAYEEGRHAVEILPSYPQNIANRPPADADGHPLPSSSSGGSHSLHQLESTLQSQSEQLLHFAEHHSSLLNSLLRGNTSSSLLETSFAPLLQHVKCRSFLHFDIKRMYFKNKLKKLLRGTAAAGGAAGAAAAAAASSSSSSYLRLHVRRAHVFEESFQALRYKTSAEMRRKLSVSFYQEEGMDAGGVSREWYSILAKEMFNINYALFTTTHSSVFQPNYQSYINPDHLAYFKFVGRIVGKAICDGIYMDIHFTRSFYKHILNQPIVYADLETTDPEYFKSLEIILQHPVDALGLDLTFSTETYEFGRIVIKDLIPNGQHVLVNDSNKMDYVKLIAQYRMTTAIEQQIAAFKEGFYELVPMDCISLFDALELELLISGLPDIDLEDLRVNTDYSGYHSHDVVITRFWNVLRSFSQEERALFLQFVTGTAKVPLDGFKALQGSDGVKRFNIHKAHNGAHLLPTAHTCFNQLDLPEYSTEEVLREKLLVAIKEGGQGFGFA